MNSNPPINIVFPAAGPPSIGPGAPSGAPVIDFLLPASSAGRSLDLITVPVSEVEFNYFSQKAADEGLTVEQWLIAGIRRAVTHPEILRAQSA